jgi:hypothetical protein
VPSTWLKIPELTSSSAFGSAAAAAAAFTGAASGTATPLLLS